MNSLKQKRVEVVILGGGVAASATAIALSASGIHALLLVRRDRTPAMAEAIPTTAIPLFHALGVGNLVAQIATVGRGLENRWDPADSIRRDDHFLLVDRAALAATLLREAQLRGAVVENISTAPAISQTCQGVIVTAMHKSREFDYAIDATGRAAVWSRPVQRIWHLVADIFEASSTDQVPALALRRYGMGWAYRIKLANVATIGVLRPRQQRQGVFPQQLADDFQLGNTGIRWKGRRAAFVQWPRRAVEQRLWAVGDAALAHDPLSGQGVRFALSCAIAIAAAIRTWRRSMADAPLATQFYEEFVATERDRHCALLQTLYGSQFDFTAVSNRAAIKPSEEETLYPRLPPRAPMKEPQAIRFNAKVEAAPLQIDGFIERGEVIRLPDGGAVRWIGGFDLIRLRDMARHPIPFPQLIERLSTEGVEAARSRALLHWCCAKGILTSEL